MKRPISPTSALGWWAFWLGVATVVWGILMPSLRELLGMAIGRASLQPLLIPMAFVLAIIEFALAAVALVVGIIALRVGERSWMALLAFVPAIIIAGFVIFSALGAALSLH